MYFYDSFYPIQQVDLFMNEMFSIIYALDLLFYKIKKYEFERQLH